MADPGEPCLKFLVTQSGNAVVARVLTGSCYESMRYSGTVSMSAELFERVVDALTYAAGNDRFFAGYRVYCGPDDEMCVD